MRLRAILFAPLMLLAASAPDHFTSGLWQGKASFDDEGQFSDCSMAMTSDTKVQLGFVITSDSDFGLLVADETLRLKPGTRKAVLLLMDGQEPIPVMARVVDVHGLLVPLQSSKSVVETIRKAKNLRVSISEKEFSFGVRGINSAIEALIECVKAHKGTSRVEL